MCPGAPTDARSDRSAELAGCRVLVTRERPGELGRLLSERGAEVVHVPLIAVVGPPDGGAALRAELERLDHYGWLVTTSPAGAERVGAAARLHPGVRLAAVGTATAQVIEDLAGREVDLVPDRQIAVELAAALLARCPEPTSFLLALADRADAALAETLSAAGHDVTSVVAYSTVLAAPADGPPADVDVVAFASGSSAQGWVEAFGVQQPPIVVAIGPSTAARARQFGLKVSGVAAEYSLAGLVDEVVHQVARRKAIGEV